MAERVDDAELSMNQLEALKDMAIDNIRKQAQVVSQVFTGKCRYCNVNRPGFPGECFICELRLPDHRFRWKHNKLFLLLPEEY
ncbi:hypothetical protein OFO97_23325, partial [Escherichia coli]|nr:hypothetical protein [Escherichia coli]